MTACKYWDCGWCYAPNYLKTNAINSTCVDPNKCPISPLSEPVKYETPMTEIEELKAQIKVLEKKLSLLEEIENHKTPCEKAYRDAYGFYPITDCMSGGSADYVSWDAFQKGYNAAYEEKVSQEPEENEWKSVALRFGEKLSGYLSDNYYELSPAAWFRWAVFTYGKGQHIKDAVRESVKWCEEHPEENPLDWVKPQTEKEVKKLQEKDWEIKVETDYLTGKARHKTKIVDKDGNDYKPEPLTTEELLKPNWEPKPQTEKEVEEGLKKAFVEAQKTEKWKETQKLIDGPWMDDLIEKFKKDPPPFLRFELGSTLEDRIYKWWEICFSHHPEWSMEECVENLLDIIELFLPREGSTAGSQDTYACIAVDAENDLLKKIKSKLRNKK